VRWLETDVSGLPIGPIFKGQAGLLIIHLLLLLLLLLLLILLWKRFGIFCGISKIVCI
jgi:hypothetical protein